MSLTDGKGRPEVGKEKGGTDVLLGRHRTWTLVGEAGTWLLEGGHCQAYGGVLHRDGGLPPNWSGPQSALLTHVSWAGFPASGLQGGGEEAAYGGLTSASTFVQLYASSGRWIIMT